MTAWNTIIPVSGTVQRDPMVDALTRYAALLGEHGAAPPVLASAATVAIAGGAASAAALVEISGTVGVTSFGTDGTLGARRLVRFQGVLTVTHSAALAMPAAVNVTTEPGTLMLAERTAAGWRVLDVRLPSLMSPGSIDVTGAIRTYLTNNRVLVREERADGTHNGTATAGSWLARGVTLTEVIDAGNLASVSGATFTLAAGTWDIEVTHVFGAGLFGARGRLFNETAGAAVAESLSTTAIIGGTNGRNTNTFVPSRFRLTLAAATTFRLEYYCAQAGATIGLGHHDEITAGVEIYATVDAMRVNA
jgi:hypothetical protein